MTRTTHIAHIGLASAAAGLLVVSMASTASAATPPLGAPPQSAPTVGPPARIAPEPVEVEFAVQPGTGCGSGRFAVGCGVPAQVLAQVPAAALRAMSAEVTAATPASTAGVEPPSSSDVVVPAAAPRAFAGLLNG